MTCSPASIVLVDSSVRWYRPASCLPSSSRPKRLLLSPDQLRYLERLQDKQRLASSETCAQGEEDAGAARGGRTSESRQASAARPSLLDEIGRVRESRGATARRQRDGRKRRAPEAGRAEEECSRELASVNAQGQTDTLRPVMAGAELMIVLHCGGAWGRKMVPDGLKHHDMLVPMDKLGIHCLRLGLEAKSLKFGSP
ncbi:hypothetical protein GUITHDRAFT_119734 [Guillardia theta CCMP2712]|uniref:Uncharacterized protein n=1 Tax=Guillardia theta (strain CCMP2712) TaxID=905079 RepID=L1IDS7_GUITC|nr:hypothetical protein GUITHDRAFT_119734 [Guillardia theta CCMP2712]EKX34064.1 hypothetical protein GUITHDRAFT_119734 [Guillardia theta CCMP2712]|eukprot:XP_005821044.1 hypothetical protein GUITHDRAFT_119734 [Guillardia theta CCMP2712]